MSMFDRCPHWVRGLLVIAVFTLATLAVFWQAPWLWRTHLYTWPGDALFNLWVTEWVADHLGSNWQAVWDPGIFHPEPGSLALSDHLIAPALVTAALRGLIEDPVPRFNLIVLSTFVLAGVTATWLGKSAGLSGAAALFTGLLFAFSPYRMDHLDHPQLLFIGFLPVALIALDRLLATGRTAWGLLLAASYGAHLFGGLYVAYMSHVLLVGVAVVHLPELLRDRRRWRGTLTALLPVALVAAVFAAVVAREYLGVSERLGMSRGVADVWAWGATVDSFVRPGEWSRWLEIFPAARARSENALFSGLVPSFLIVAGLVALTVSIWRDKRRRFWLVATVALFGAGLALGDWRTANARHGGDAVSNWLVAQSGQLAALLVVVALSSGIWLTRRARPGVFDGVTKLRRGVFIGSAVAVALTFPWFYLLVRDLIPGLSGMRVTARFFAPASLGLTLFAGWMFDRVLRSQRLGRAAKALALLLTVGAAVELYPRQIRWTELAPPADLQPAYGWLATQRDVSALVEVPIRHDGDEVLRMYASLGHRHRLFNGYSGYFPRHYSALRPALASLPDAETLGRLSTFGVSHLVVHRQLEMAPQPPRSTRRVPPKVDGRPVSAARLQLLWRDPAIEVFRIEPSTEVGQARPMVFPEDPVGAPESVGPVLSH